MERRGKRKSALCRDKFGAKWYSTGDLTLQWNEEASGRVPCVVTRLAQIPNGDPNSSIGRRGQRKSASCCDKFGSEWYRTGNLTLQWYEEANGRVPCVVTRLAQIPNGGPNSPMKRRGKRKGALCCDKGEDNKGEEDTAMRSPQVLQVNKRTQWRPLPQLISRAPPSRPALTFSSLFFARSHKRQDGYGEEWSRVSHRSSPRWVPDPL